MKKTVKYFLVFLALVALIFCYPYNFMMKIKIERIGYTKIIDALEINQVYKNKYLCEPKLDKYNLYPPLSMKNNKNTSTIKIKNLLTYFDGKLDLISICDKLNLSIWDVKDEVNKLIEKGLIRKI